MGRLFFDLAEWTVAALRTFGAPEQDAKDAASEAMLRLLKSWKEIQGERTIYTLKAWLETTAIRAFLQCVRDERRNRTESMQEDCGPTHGEESGLTREELIADDSTPELWDYSLVRQEDVQAVKAAMLLIVAECQAKHRGALPPCSERCELLWRRHAGYERTTLEDLSQWVGKPMRTVYDWLKKCEKRFKRAIERKT